MSRLSANPLLLILDIAIQKMRRAITLRRSTASSGKGRRLASRRLTMVITVIPAASPITVCVGPWSKIEKWAWPLQKQGNERRF